MISTLLDLLADARRVGITLTRDGDQLTIRAPRTAAALARALLARKHDVFDVLDVYTGRAPVLNWHAAIYAFTPAPCAVCVRPTRLRDPFDHQPRHKTCTERQLTAEAPTR